MVTVANCIGIFLLAGYVFAQVTVNILAVNATDQPREKDISYVLPADIGVNDILDSNGLEVDYSVDDSAYYVHGKVVLDPKETKTLKIRMRDVWLIDETEIGKIEEQIDKNLDRLKNTEHYESGIKKKKNCRNVSNIF